MNLNPLKLFASSNPPTEALAEVRSGRARLAGTARAGADVLSSPIKGIQSVAFFYRAFYSVQGRTGWAERTLKRAEVYAPEFVLEMRGGTVRVKPKKPGAFSGEEHREISSGGLPRFKAEEQVVRPGDRVTISGRVFQDTDGFFIRPTQIELIATKRSQRPATGAPGKKKRLKTKRKRA